MKTTKISENVTQITFSKAELLNMDKEAAKREGITVAEYRRQKKEAMKMWCSCDEPGDPEFHDDGEGTGPYCCGKHHYHCSKCGKITQIG